MNNMYADLKEMEYQAGATERAKKVEEIRVQEELRRCQARASTPALVTPESRHMAAGGLPLRSIISYEMEAQNKVYRDYLEDQMRANLIHARSTDDEKIDNEVDRLAWKAYQEMEGEEAVRGRD